MPTDTEKLEWPAPEASLEGGAMATPSDNCPLCEQRWGEGDPDFVCLGCKRPLTIVPREDIDKLAAVKTEIISRKAAHACKRHGMTFHNVPLAHELQGRIAEGNDLLRFIDSLDKEPTDAP